MAGAKISNGDAFAVSAAQTSRPGAGPFLVRTRQVHRPLLFLCVGFASLFAFVLTTGWLVYHEERSSFWVQHTLRIDKRLWTVLSQLQDIEIGQRGYLLTADDQFLGPYVRARSVVPVQIAQLEALVTDNPAQLDALADLRSKAAALEVALEDSVRMKGQGDETWRARLIDSKVTMDDIRGIVATMVGAEERLLHDRIEADQNWRLLTGAASVGTALATLVLAAFAYREISRRLTEANAARDDLAGSLKLLRAEVATRAAAEAQVRQLQKMEAIGQLTGGIAHDFNNMLAIVIGSLEMAKRRIERERERAIALLDNAMEGAQRAAQLTSRLLAFSRQQALEPMPVDVNRLVGNMSELLRRSIGEAIRLETVLAGGLWRVYVDAGQLENTIVNLCVNGRDAMAGGGKLTIETSNAHLDDAYAAAHADVTAGQYVVVAVSDTGTGMTPAVIERAFDAFYTTKGPGQGTGLGLSQVYGFVKQSGGHIKIYSELGHGTTVKLYLPRYFGNEASTTMPSAAADTPRAVKGETVLVVEDEAQVRRMSVEALRDLGYEVIEAPDAAVALDALMRSPEIDLLFTDVVMPDMTGRRLAEIAVEHRPDLKILYTTGYTRNAVVHGGILDSGVVLLSKPFTLDQLAAKIRQVLDAGG